MAATSGSTSPSTSRGAFVGLVVEHHGDPFGDPAEEAVQVRPGQLLGHGEVGAAPGRELRRGQAAVLLHADDTHAHRDAAVHVLQHRGQDLLDFLETLPLELPRLAAGDHRRYPRLQNEVQLTAHAGGVEAGPVVAERCEQEHHHSLDHLAAVDAAQF